MTGSPDTQTASATAPEVPAFRRILIKLSGEALMGSQQFGIDTDHVRRLAEQLAKLQRDGVEVAIVVGAGNYVRGASQAELGIDRATGDYMGMLATLLNAMPIQDALEKIDIPTRIMSAMAIQEVAEPYIRRRAIRHLEKGRVVIFAAGTGNPYFTTDTAAALRALEIGADAILMAKNNVEGVYDRDPREHDDAELLTELSHSETVRRDLRVMDHTALTLCGEHGLSILVFNMSAPDNIGRIVAGERIGTLIRTPKEN